VIKKPAEIGPEDLELAVKEISGTAEYLDLVAKDIESRKKLDDIKKGGKTDEKTLDDIRKLTSRIEDFKDWRTQQIDKYCKENPDLKDYKQNLEEDLELKEVKAAKKISNSPAKGEVSVENSSVSPIRIGSTISSSGAARTT